MTAEKRSSGPNKLAEQLLAALRADHRLDPALLDQLVGIANSDSPKEAAAGTGALFAEVVEPLCDSFLRSDRDDYYRLMAAVIGLCRKHPDGEKLDQALGEFDLLTDRDLIQSVAKVISAAPLSVEYLADVRRVYFLSRVTLGADVAVTSVGIGRVSVRLPQARFILVGGNKLGHLFGGNRRVELAELAYPRRGRLLDRINGWLAALDFFKDENFGKGDLLIDPDTRISQVGLLPPVADFKRYLFFEGVCEPGDERPLGQHFGHFLDHRIGSATTAHVEKPTINLRKRDWALADEIFRLTCLDRRKVVAVSLGVGGNERKRIDDRYERELLGKLIDSGHAVLLDKGPPDEHRRIDALIDDRRSKGASVASFNEAGGGRPLAEIDKPPDLVTWDGGIGPFAALIGRSAGYIGYDSLFQHVAGALSVPLVTVFAGYDNELFPVRWQPFGHGPIRIIKIERNQPIPDDLADQVVGGLP